MTDVTCDECWLLLYTKPRAESWAELNIRRQGFQTLLPRFASRRGPAPLFPRYLFVHGSTRRLAICARSTRGISNVVHCGDSPAFVSDQVISEIRDRMDGSGMIQVEATVENDPLFARSQRARLRALERLAASGFRVRVA